MPEFTTDVIRGACPTRFSSSAPPRMRSDWVKTEVAKTRKGKVRDSHQRCSHPDRGLRDRAQAGVSMLQMMACAHTQFTLVEIHGQEVRSPAVDNKA
jgi:hypothetical protein